MSFSPPPLEKLKVEMKRSANSEHDNIIPRKSRRISLSERAREGDNMGLGVGKGYHKESNLLGDQTKVEGITAAQGKTFGEGSKKATTEVGRIQPVRTSPRASETVDDLVHMLRSTRPGNQAKNHLKSELNSFLELMVK